MKHPLPRNVHEVARVMKRGLSDASYWVMQQQLPIRCELFPDGYYRICSSKKGPVLEIKKKRTEQVRIEYTTYNAETF